MSDEKRNHKTIRTIVLGVSVAILIALSSVASAESEDKQYRIGVLAKRGQEMCLQKWSPTAQYLTETVDGAGFVIIPLDFEQIYTAVKAGEVDFVIANSSFYVGLEAAYGVSRMVTLKNMRQGKVRTVFGGVIFTKATSDINRLSDIEGKTFMAVKETSFGGWQMAWREFKGQGIDPHTDFADMRFGGTHDAVVYAVRDGEVDAGTVRTDTLERMADEGKIDLNDFKHIFGHNEHRHLLANNNEHDIGQFPFVHSTRLYPEWPFAKTIGTSDEIAEKVSAALLSMPANSVAAKAARCAGWTIPYNYTMVHNCLKELKIGPYKDYGQITIAAMVREYGVWILGVVCAVVATIVFSIHMYRLNSKLVKSTTERKQAEESIQFAYKELEQANRELKEMQSQLIQNEKLASIGQLAAGVAHEMNTPVGFVASNFRTLENYLNKFLMLLVGYEEVVELIDTGTKEERLTKLQEINEMHNKMKIDFILEDIQELFNDSREGLDRVTDIIQNLRDFSRIDQSGSRDKYDLNKGIEATLVVAKNTIKYDADVTTDFSELPMIFCHSGQINQVFLNILVNAAQAIKAQERDGQGSITITTYASETEVVCEIADDGPGISPDTLSKVFDPFFTTKPAGKGTGLGLSVSYDIITNKHNGMLLVDSKVGEGTKFTIKLPIGTKENEEKEIIRDGKENSVICGR